MIRSSLRFCASLTSGANAISSVMISDSGAKAERSFLRHIIPMRIQGPGNVATLYRHAFIHQEHLISRLFGALNAVPLPALPRMLLAEGFQRLLEGEARQRDIRALFEEAENEARRMLFDAEFYAGKFRQQRDGHLYVAIKNDPLTRLLAYELRAACGYYAQMLAIKSQPEYGAAALLRTLIAADIRTDPFLVELMLNFAALRRNVSTGERLEPCTPAVEEFVKECLLLERDAFGRFRFDARGDNRHLLHCIKLRDIVKTPGSFAVVLDPLLQKHGNFCLQSSPVHQGRWVEHRLSCAEEFHRVDERLPLLETVTVLTDFDASGGDSAGDFNRTVAAAPSLEFIVLYNSPLCHRHKETTREKEAGVDHVEVFELAVENTNLSFWEKWFMDR